jgi:hypothetical protein
VTVVSSDGTIHVSGSGVAFTPYVQGLSFFSNKSDTNWVIKINGAGNLGGTAYAPGGRIALEGAGGTIEGAFLGDRVKVAGSGATINMAPVCLAWDEGDGGGGDTVDCAIYDVRSTAGGAKTTARVQKCEGEDIEILYWYVGE